MKQIIIFFMAVMTGCTSHPPATQTDIVTRVGFLAELIMQHPIVVSSTHEKQFYFDLGERPRSMHQIIVIYPIGMEIPTDSSRQIELTGTIRHISLKGGKVGDGRYSNDILTLKSWQYLE